ncbi:peptidase domain-containing ABC transporter [Magnetospira sp. QH-2]|uniref:peptidase domain-containing ABC transporter n=1 Tax=Magnetospira sp. (strain QH-2) TaxID=1288970 RepID=UPI000A5B5F3A|nr:ABC transporter transmembrane domain-containing protein [Magnetospira sp. QH-2]
MSAFPELFMSSLFLNVLSLALPLALLQVYDRIVPNSSRGTLVMLIFGVLTALFLESLLRIARSSITGWIGARFEHRAGCAAFDHMLGTSLQEFERVGSGVQLERISSLRTVKEFYAGQAVTAVLDLPFAFFFLALIWMLGGYLVWVPATTLALFALVTVFKSSSLKKAIDNYTQARDRRLNFTIEVLGGVHSVKSMAMEALMLRRYSRLQETTAEADYRVALENASAMSTGVFFSQLTMIGVAAFGATMVVDNLITVGVLASCTLLSGRALQPLQRAVGLWTRFQTVSLARKRLKEIFKLPLDEEPENVNREPIEGALEMRHVKFKFADDLPEIMTDINLDVLPGECVGIAGSNSSGKSTLLGLMTGALRPTEGEVLIDGIPLTQHDPYVLKHGGIAYLPQEGELFQGTILDNLTMFRLELVDEAIEVANMLGLDEVVANLPFGFDTRVGDAAYESLPRGIRQRIAIARALVGQPKIVLFDEANTAVDGTGDAYLRLTLERLKGVCTLILVTPRPSLLRLANRAFDLKDGTLVPRDMSAPRGAKPGGGGAIAKPAAAAEKSA